MDWILLSDFVVLKGLWVYLGILVIGIRVLFGLLCFFGGGMWIFLYFLKECFVEFLGRWILGLVIKWFFWLKIKFLRLIVCLGCKLLISWFLVCLVFGVFVNDVGMLMFILMFFFCFLFDLVFWSLLSIYWRFFDIIFFLIVVCFFVVLVWVRWVN